jgi:hypothetical protein
VVLTHESWILAGRQTNLLGSGNHAGNPNKHLGFLPLKQKQEMKTIQSKKKSEPTKDGCV